jgi:hypothetical protein
MEGEFVWQPQDDLAFNMTISLTRSAAGNAFVVDQRNPTAGQANAILVKDVTNGSLCVIQAITPAATGHTPGESSAFHVNNFYLPNGGNAAIDAPFGVPLVNYGLCQGGETGGVISPIRTALRAAGFDYTSDVAPNGALGIDPLDPTGHKANGTGIATNIQGNRLPDTPNAQIGVGAQYTMHISDWQSDFYARVNNDPSDLFGGWDTMNGQIQLNAPDGMWYAKVFATNIFDKHNATGVYLTDPTSALFTNVFSEDPRVVGVSVGASW